MSDEPLPPKQEVARALMLEGSVFVHLDPRVEGVAVPRFLAAEPQLVIQVGLDMPVPIPDLRVDAKGVFGTLSFNRSGFACEIPWASVFALVGEDGRGMVWPESMPLEIVEEVNREAGKQPPVPSSSELDDPDADVVEASTASLEVDKPPGIFELHVVPEVTPSVAAPDVKKKETPSDGTVPKRPPYLRVVK